MTTYAVLVDLPRFGAGAATVGVATADQQAAIDAASAVADGYLGMQYTLPLVSWGDDLRRAVCMIAAYDVMAGNRGYNPDNASDVNLRLRYQDAIDWLERIAKGTLFPPGIVDSTPSTPEGGSYIITNARRGW